MPDKRPKLSVAIVNYKTASLTKQLLLSLLKEDKDVEIIVLDNGSGDEMGKIIAKEFPGVKFIQSETNLGFSKGYNLVMDQCQGRYILMLNSDIEVKEGSLSKLLKAEEAYGGKAVLTGKLILPDRSVQKSVFHLPTIKSAIREYFLGQKEAFFNYLPDQNKPSLVEGAVMACLLIPKEIRDKIGKLDEGTSLYFEDVEYCRRLQKTKIPIYYIPEAVFLHHHGAASKTLANNEAQKKLKIASIHYHGLFKHTIINIILWIGQKVRSLQK